MMSLAASFPPRPKAKPPAIAIMTTIPVNKTVNKSAAIFNCTNAAINANTKIDHFVNDARKLEDFNFADSLAFLTILYNKLATNIPMINIATAAITFGKYATKPSKNSDN